MNIRFWIYDGDQFSLCILMEFSKNTIIYGFQLLNQNIIIVMTF